MPELRTVLGCYAQHLRRVHHDGQMLRRVHHDGQTVSAAAASFGFSRPSFYEAQSALREAGLPGLLHQRRRPRRAHKLSTEVMTALREARERDPSLTTPQLVELVRERFGLAVHRRSIERALARATPPETMTC